MATDTPEEMAETIACVLDGQMGMSLTDMRWGVREMDGLAEFYVRNGSDEVFRFVCDRVGPDEFDPFAEDE